MDITNPASPRHVAILQHDDYNNKRDGGHDIKIHGNYLITASYVDGLNFFDISNPIRPIEVAEIHSTEENGLMAVADLAISENYLFAVSEVGNALVMIDIANPLKPVIVDVIHDDESGEMFLWNGHYVETYNNYVFVAGLQDGFGIAKFK